MQRTRLAVDIGGTFTDVALEHEGRLSTTKVLTLSASPAGTNECTAKWEIPAGKTVECGCDCK